VSRVALALAVLGVLAVGAAAVAEQDQSPQQPEQTTFDLGSVANRMFGDLALLPTRLTSYNSHDDAATASYTCCHPDQEADIERALRANADFVRMYPTSDFADDALLHSGYVNGVKRDMLHQVECFAEVARNYPDSDVWDDAMWNLAQCYARDKDRPAEIDVLHRLIARRPHSVWADDACLALSRACVDLRDEDGALAALQTLATEYRTSEYCDDALFQVAQKYQTLGSYEDAIAAYTDLLNTWPMSDYVDDAQFGIAQSLRAMHNLRDALPAYEVVIHRMPGSPLVRPSMAEVNTMREGTYDLQGHYPCDDAEDLWDLAGHYQNYRQFADAIAAYAQFIRAFPGHDNYDDAWFNIGVCYQEMNRLFQKINESQGKPDELYRLKEDLGRGTGGALSTIPSDRQLSAVEDAAGAFAVVANNLIGSNLRDRALREIAKSYEHSGMDDAAAFTYQEKIIYFPYETEPDEGDMRGKGALCKTLRYYADPAHYPDGKDRYMALAKAHPDVFPPELYSDKDQFLSLMQLYLRHAEHSFYEMKRHIPYRLSVDDLRQDARYYLACLNMQRGETRAAISLLKPFFDAPTSDFAAPAALVFARAQELQGDKKDAAKAYRWIIDVHGLSGLADDAQDGLARLEQGGEDLTWVGDEVEAVAGSEARNYDVWAGKDVVVVAPWLVAAKMRQYNMPNIWDEAQRQLCSWTGAKSGERQVVLASPKGGAPRKGVVLVDAWQVNDPPSWGLGLTDMARNAVLARGSKALASSPVFVGALAKFGAAALQYQLVTETRDTIGSASAVKLPQEEVIRARESALKALEEYVRQEPEPAKLNEEIVAGMLYTLLDSHGYGKHALIDWEPYARFFEAVCRDEGGCNVGDKKQVSCLFVKAMNQAFGADCGEQFASWGFPVEKTGRVGSLLR
jgi:TolA-binding protein